jgi:PAS domain-containing protein
MARLKNRIMVRFAIYGFLGGILFLWFGVWLELQQQNLPFTVEAYLTLHKEHYVFYLLDLTPFVFCGLAGLAGLQHSLISLISKGKREWESTFDALQDPIFILDIDNRIIRCNLAFIAKLNTAFYKVIGRSIFKIEGLAGIGGIQNTSIEYSWLGRVYTVSAFPIQLENQFKHELYIFHDITEYKQA